MRGFPIAVEPAIGVDAPMRRMAMIANVVRADDDFRATGGSNRET
jgi:hypothetical protein